MNVCSLSNTLYINFTLNFHVSLNNPNFEDKENVAQRFDQNQKFHEWQNQDSCSALTPSPEPFYFPMT